jgi:hypothetical protein
MLCHFILVSKWWNQLLTPVMLFSRKLLHPAACLSRIFPFDIHPLANGESSDRKLSGIPKFMSSARHYIQFPALIVAFWALYDMCISFLFFNMLFNDAINC